MKKIARPIVVVILVMLLGGCGSAAPEQAVVVQADEPDETAPAVVTPAPTVSAGQLTTGPTVALPTVTPRPTADIAPTNTATPTKREPTATRRPTRTPTPELQIHVIEQFDTILGLAVEYDTTTEAILEANGLAETDLLQIGQELIIPESGQVIPATTGDEAAEESAATEVETSGADEAIAAESTQTEAGADAAPAVSGEDPAPAEAAVEAEAAPAAPPPAQMTSAGSAGAIQAAPAGGSNINPLTGLRVSDPSVLTRRPLMVRIGNDPGARRAQKGLNSADMVYEEITEWWVTRLTAIFLGNTPEVVGPIRSVRLVNVQLVPQYSGALAHSGGSDPVRWEVSQSRIAADLDEFFHPAPYFYLEGEGWETRLSVDTEAARNYLAANGLDAQVSLPSFFFSNRISRGQAGEDIYIPYPGSSFTEWHYDSASGKYLRWINGTPMRDIFSGQVAASNVIVYFADHQRTDIVEDSTGATSVRILVNGSGPAWFFRDGKLNKGFWQTDGSRPPYFTFEDGEPYTLKPGNTWVQLVPLSYTIGLDSPDEAGR